MYINYSDSINLSSVCINYSDSINLSSAYIDYSYNINLSSVCINCSDSINLSSAYIDYSYYINLSSVCINCSDSINLSSAYIDYSYYINLSPVYINYWSFIDGLFGFLTSSSTTSLYRGWAPRQSVWQFYVLPHMRQSWETMTSVSAGLIILTPSQPVGNGRPQRESNPGPPHWESRALPTELPPRPLYQLSSWNWLLLNQSLTQSRSIIGVIGWLRAAADLAETIIRSWIVWCYFLIKVLPLRT